MESLQLFYYGRNKRSAFYILDDIGISGVDKPA